VVVARRSRLPAKGNTVDDALAIREALELYFEDEALPSVPISGLP